MTDKKITNKIITDQESNIITPIAEKILEALNKRFPFDGEPLNRAYMVNCLLACLVYIGHYIHDTDKKSYIDNISKMLTLNLLPQDDNA